MGALPQRSGASLPGNPALTVSGANEETSHTMLPAAKWGAIVGVVIYLVSQGITVVNRIALGGAPADPNHPATITLGCLNLLLIAFSFSASGFYTGRETRQAGLGAIAGMITFVVYGALGSVYSVSGRAQLGFGGATLGEQVIIALVIIVVYLCISALIGWLGGRPGAARAKRTSAAPQPSTREPAQESPRN